ncbi:MULTISPECIES: conjugative transfer ATPase [Steroidobacteraceae]|nr:MULTISPECIES: conjugative transfer ATPase [Steroidobacteraceae]
MKAEQDATAAFARAPSKPSEPSADAWEQYVAHLRAHGIPAPDTWRESRHRRATLADERALYDVAPSFVDMLPWVEFLPNSQSLLLEDGRSVAAFFELTPIATEGRETLWLDQVRDALEDSLQDSLDELDDDPWVVQLYAQDETGWDPYLRALRDYVHPRAKGTAFTEFYLRLVEHHLRSVSRPGGLFRDNAVTQLPWRGQTRRVRMVVYRRLNGIDRAGRHWASRNASPREAFPEQDLTITCDRLVGGLSNAGIKARRLGAADIHAWLVRWFNPSPAMLGTSPEARERFYQLVAYPEDSSAETLELASGTDFAQRLFFGSPRSDADHGVWSFDERPHRVVVLDRLRTPPVTGHTTGETSKSGEAINALFDQFPDDTVMCITLVITPQDRLESHLNYLARKSVGDTLDSEQTRQDVQQARSTIGRAHKLYRGAIAFYIHGRDLAELDDRTLQLTNALLGAGLQPVREHDEVAPLNSYLRWLPCKYNPAMDRRQWYTQLMWAQHVANLAPIWGRHLGTGHPGMTFFNRGGGLVSIDPLNRLDRQMNAHLFLFGPTGSGKSATLSSMLNQVTAIYRPRVFVVEAGNSFGLFADFARRLGLSVHRVRLAPGAGVSLAPFTDARRLVETPNDVQTLDVDALDEPDTPTGRTDDPDEQRDVLGELEITARLMITGGEEQEEARMTRADRSLIRQCIIDAAQYCSSQRRTVLAGDVHDALRRRASDPVLPEPRRTRLLEMADAMDMFCQGADGELFNRPGTPWPEADITIVDLATFAREGYHAQLAVAYVSLINAVNNIAERDQYLGRPLINVTDEGHIITRNPLLAPYVVKITKMWRKLGAWFWLATQNLDDLPAVAKLMLNMIEWWICLSMPVDEVEKVARFRELSPAQKALLRSARKEMGKYSEGVILSKSTEILFRAVPPSLYLAQAMTESDEKHERHQLMTSEGISELQAAMRVAERLDRSRGIEPLSFEELIASTTARPTPGSPNK